MVIVTRRGMHGITVSPRRLRPESRVVPRQGWTTIGLFENTARCAAGSAAGTASQISRQDSTLQKACARRNCLMLKHSMEKRLSHLRNHRGVQVLSHISGGLLCGSQLASEEV